MSLAITHFAVGAACTAVVLTVIPRVPFQRTLVVCGGIWAMLPDAWRFLPTAGARYAHEFHATALANLFWFHSALDRADVGDSQATGVALLAAFLLVTAVVEYRDYRAPEPLREALSDGSREDD
ncbi:hypothetical protein HZS55_02130 [Halosimplex rubrum]|uniref:Uncharacterized protein n=1 Tax=Halosimplex rubrum TaxID=869889 RepID=A0A7D5TLW8_9EURY|nr:hypothetical protein [Halosimplex rubrum]QLH76174.1 hypothetical protein HZS55_02130 [Halosimplex rubrum]